MYRRRLQLLLDPTPSAMRRSGHVIGAAIGGNGVIAGFESGMQSAQCLKFATAFAASGNVRTHPGLIVVQPLHGQPGQQALRLRVALAFEPQNTPGQGTCSGRSSNSVRSLRRA
jgi:hypothetical protein